MTVWRRETPSITRVVASTLEDWAAREREARQHSWKTLVAGRYERVGGYWKELTGINGRNRKLWVS